MTTTPAKTPLYDWHVEHGGRMVDFAGWSMPVQYTSIVEEHRATRTAAGVFDVSHMGRLRFEGTDAAAFLDRLLTRRVTDLSLGRIRYSLVTNDQGGVLDDVLVGRLKTPSERQYLLLVVNASNRAKIVDWITHHWPTAGDVEFSDRTEDTAMIAVQGPRAMDIVAPLVKADVRQLGYYTGVVTETFGRICIVSRTGYTGEDGVELIVRAADAADVWKNIFLAGRDVGVTAAGLGARDTLRLESGMPLYGHELSEQINPYQAGLGFAVNLPDREFIGREALAKFQADPQQPRRVGLTVAGRRVAREHSPVLAAGQVVGQVTSGTFSPTFDQPIAMAYVRPEVAAVGTELQVDIRGRGESARVVKLPFYTRSSG
ncbi:MAG: glycine cleavage system aminomethyltransferase GcvT [Planctomycetota bacterium]|nr:glycine cleavage system aminomethyltransferase GcvT [Planctomycetota bacterium]